MVHRRAVAELVLPALRVESRSVSSWAHRELKFVGVAGVRHHASPQRSCGQCLGDVVYLVDVFLGIQGKQQPAASVNRLGWIGSTSSRAKAFTIH